MKLIRRAWGIVKENKRVYIIINVIFYGLVVIFMLVAAFNQPLQKQLMSFISLGLTQGPLAAVGGAYISGQVLDAMVLTFVVNFFIGSLFDLTLPSLIIPFSGMLIGIVRAILWGFLLSPAAPQLRFTMIPHSLTLLLEGQGYVLVMLAVYVQGRAFIWPQTVGKEGHGQGFVEGIKRTGVLYILVAITLLAAAIYEALEVILLVPMFSR
jgi:hypothetical protein